MNPMVLGVVEQVEHVEGLVIEGEQVGMWGTKMEQVVLAIEEGPVGLEQVEVTFLIEVELWAEEWAGVDPIV